MPEEAPPPMPTGASTEWANRPANANDGQCPTSPLGALGRKRLDPRRNTKPKKPEQAMVCTPFDPNGFNFSKIRNPDERLLRLELQSGAYDVLTNKFPLFEKHMLLVCKDLVPQQMTKAHLSAITELLQACSFCAYFNSWCASASVNHFHCHLIDEFPPVTSRPLVPGPTVEGVRSLQPAGFSGFCYVFEVVHAANVVSELIRSMQADNQPHNMLFTPRHIYVWPKPHVRPQRSFELYPETVGGPELIGSFTVYQQAHLEILSAMDCDELFRLNTAPLPSRHLQKGLGLDDSAVPTPTSASMAFEGVAAVNHRRLVPASQSVDLQSLQSMLPHRGVGLAASAGNWRGRRRDAGGGA